MLSRSRKYAALPTNGNKYGCKCNYTAIKFGSAASQKTQEYAQTVNDSVIKPTREKVNEGTLFSDLSTGTKSWASKLTSRPKADYDNSETTPVASSSQKGWSGFTAIWSDEPTTLDKLEGPPSTDTPLMGDPKAREERDKLRTPDADDNWGWGEDDTWGNSETKEKTTKVSNDGWDTWGNDEQGDLLLDFDDNPKPSKSKTTKTNTQSNSSSKPIKSLEDDWNDDGGWDDAAWDAVEQEVKGKKGD